uniref:Sulfotransferase family-containing protein n=1 Tax=Strongyloides papillosus TaxID=174720 RepID=A0A0N5BR67_STREA
MNTCSLLLSIIFLFNENVINGKNNKETSIESVIPCNISNDTKPCIGMPLKPYKGEYIIANIYKINSCIIGKTFSSMQLGVFCYLFDEKKFLKNYKNRRNKAANRNICKSNNRYYEMDKVIEKFSSNNSTQYFSDWKNLLVVREPISRFLSGFVQLCVLNIGLDSNHPYCFGCGRNMHCFLTHLYHDLLNVSKKKKKSNSFIKYHFYPQTWQCQYNLYKDKYTIIHYDFVEKKKFYDKYIEELESSNVSKEKLEFIRKMLYTSKVSHSTFDKSETKKYKKDLYKSPRLLTLISKIFYNDYIEFGFILPIIRN